MIFTGECMPMYT